MTALNGKNNPVSLCEVKCEINNWKDYTLTLALGCTKILHGFLSYVTNLLHVFLYLWHIVAFIHSIHIIVFVHWYNQLSLLHTYMLIFLLSISPCPAALHVFILHVSLVWYVFILIKVNLTFIYTCWIKLLLIMYIVCGNLSLNKSLIN